MQIDIICKLRKDKVITMLDLFLEFLKLYWGSVLVSAVFISVLIFLWKQGKKDLVKRIILDLVCKAEQKYGSGTSVVKLGMVWGEIYRRLPLLVRLVFTQAELQGFIEEWVSWLKKKLKENENYLSSYSEERLNKTIEIKLPYQKGQPLPYEGE